MTVEIIGTNFTLSLGAWRLRLVFAIEEADVIVYDYLCNPEILGWSRPDAEIIYAGKQASAHTLSQTEINELILQRAKEGKLVVRLKGGDPFVFGRGAEEAEILAQAAILAVKQWRYRPYLLNGEPVEVDSQITINFTLSRG